MKKNDKKTTNKTKTTKTNKTSTKIDIEKININKMNDVECETMKQYLLLQLKNATIRRDKCRIRQQLRKHCNHYGALRNRTYVDKINNTRHVVERKNDVVETSTTK